MSEKNAKGPTSGLVPRLRFPEFEGDWEEALVGRLISAKSDKYNPLSDEESYPCIELESLSQESGELLSTFNSKNQKSIKNVFEAGDVLFGKLRPYLKKYFLADFNGVCSSEIWVLKSKIFNPDYLYSYIQTRAFLNLTEVSSGSKMPRADWELISSSSIYYPKDFRERGKIAQLITLIGIRLSTQNKIISHYQTLIQNLRELLFTQQLRFKDENGNDFSDWEEKMIEKVFVVSAGGDIQKINVSEVQTELFKYPIYANSEDNKGLYGYSDIYKAGENTITVTGRGNIGIANARNHKFYPIVRLLVLQPKVQCNTVFFEHQINLLKIHKESTGVPQLTAPQISNYSLNVPSIVEQNCIANFLSSITEKIEAEQQLLEQYEKQKAYLLQNLFV